VVWSPGAWQGGGGRAAQVARRSTARRQRLGLWRKGDTEEGAEERKKELARRGPGHGVESARICLHECTHR